jgi:hypothetical protein
MCNKILRAIASYGTLAKIENYISWGGGGGVHTAKHTHLQSIDLYLRLTKPAPTTSTKTARPQPGPLNYISEAEKVHLAHLFAS